MYGTSAMAPGWRNASLRREIDVRLTKRMVAIVAGLVLALTPFLMYTLLQIDYLRVRYRIEELRGRYDRALEAERRLLTERAKLEALPRVETLAQRQLGLVRAGATDVLVLRRIAQDRGAGGVRAPDETRPAAR